MKTVFRLVFSEQADLQRPQSGYGEEEETEDERRQLKTPRSRESLTATQSVRMRCRVSRTKLNNFPG